MKVKYTRNDTFDIVRGLAVLSMVIANMAPLYTQEFPLVLRVIFSIAAPTFALISGVMVSFVSNKHSAGYFLTKGAFILLIAALTDKFIHDIVPFEGFDILYFMGICVPLTFFVGRGSKTSLVVMILLSLIAGVLLRDTFGFRHGSIMSDVPAEGWGLFPAEAPYQFWFVDGSFPIFPWFGIMLFGCLLHKFYAQKKGENFFSTTPVMLLSIASLS